MSVLLSLLLSLRTWVRSRAALQLEVLALRHQLQVLQRTRPRRLRLAKADRWLRGQGIDGGVIETLAGSSAATTTKHDESMLEQEIPTARFSILGVKATIWPQINFLGSTSVGPGSPAPRVFENWRHDVILDSDAAWQAWVAVRSVTAPQEEHRVMFRSVPASSE
jgi:hypothetical protein